MIEIKHGFHWLPAEPVEAGFVVKLRQKSAQEFVGLFLSAEIVARRFREGRARVAADPRRPIATTDAGVAKILGTIGIDHDLTPTAA
jgi:hypothetical protein